MQISHSTRSEDLANWATHAVAALAAVAGLAILAESASTRGDVWHLIGCCTFGATLVMLYASSAIYHALPRHMETTKARWKTVDHAAIYLLIAGSYTPFMLVHLRGPWGWSLLGVVWAMALVGIVCETTRVSHVTSMRVGIYVTMGWSVLVAIRPLHSAVPEACLWLIVLGGVVYTSGILFFRWGRLRYHHAIWHTFVMAGSTLHYLAVLYYVIPAAVVV